MSMSARFFKIFLGVFWAHCLVLSIVWVGFSVQGSRPPAAFIYQGELPAGAGSGTEEDLFGRQGAGPLASDQIIFDHSEEPNFNHWTNLRGLSK